MVKRNKQITVNSSTGSSITSGNESFIESLVLIDCDAAIAQWNASENEMIKFHKIRAFGQISSSTSHFSIVGALVQTNGTQSVGATTNQNCLEDVISALCDAQFAVRYLGAAKVSDTKSVGSSAEVSCKFNLEFPNDILKIINRKLLAEDSTKEKYYLILVGRHYATTATMSLNFAVEYDYERIPARITFR